MAIKELSQRQLKVGQEIRKIIAGLIEREEIRNLHGIKALVTITEVQVSPDLKYCYAYFVVSDEKLNDEVFNALQLAANYIRKQVGKKTSLRYVPEIFFKVDESFAEVSKIEAILQDEKVQRDLKKVSG